ncbi:hypothetical protein HPB50_021366 [Hyalomma asiaticum]|uniref:Uncharacterized protein n=1 Tax=Hyalomma asiaticum TaxID=266040 RepID=A0ACB7RPQ3_HYAAI|nr:hypothetical protein HPB50_021366 [Hyalomma asiaticum]
MAARIVRTSVCGCIRIQATLAGSAHSRCLSTSRALLIRGTKLSVEREDRFEERCADDDFFGISSDDGVVTVDNPLGDRHERLRRFSHLTRSRSARVSDETVVAADFGTIRYDSDNRARYHGQFEDDALLDDFVLDAYGRSGEENTSKTAREAPVERANESERQNLQEGSVAAKKSARKKKKSRDSATPVSTEPQDRDLGDVATAKLSKEVARDLQPRSLPIDDRQFQGVKGHASSRVVEKSSSEFKGVASMTESLGPAWATEQNNMLDSDCLESVAERVSPAEATVKQRQRSAEYGKDRGVEELSESGVSTPHSSAFEGFVTSARTAEEGSLESPVSETTMKASRKPRSKDRRENDDKRNVDHSFPKETVTITAAPFEHRQAPLSTVTEGSSVSQDINKTRSGKAKEAKASDEGNAGDSSGDTDEGNPTAFEYLHRPQQMSLKLDSKGFLILKSEVRPNLAMMLRSEVVDMLRQRVLYDGNDILVLDKPYGMICHGSAKGVPDAHVLVRLLPELSSALYPRKDVKLYTVHRLDRDVTGGGDDQQCAMASSKVREQVEAYFRDLNYASSRIVQDMSLVREAHGDDWDRISEKKKTEIAWDALVGPDIKEKYNYYPKQYAEVEVFPVIGLNTGDRMQSCRNPASEQAAVALSPAKCRDSASTAVEVNNKVVSAVSAAKTSTFKPCLVSNSASEPNVGRVAGSKTDTSSNTLDGSGLKHVKFSNGVESRVPPAAQSRAESRAVIGGSLPRVIHADPKVQAGASTVEHKVQEPRPPPPSRSQESVCSIASRGSSNPPTPVERKGRRRAPTPPKAPPPDPPRPKTAPPKPPAAAAAHSQKPPEAPRKHPSTKPPAPPIPTVKSPAREVAPKLPEKEAPLEVTPVRPPRLPSPPKDDPKDTEETPKELVAVRSPEVVCCVY